jgi:membrane protease YdiL (CAAX protease family)
MRPSADGRRSGRFPENRAVSLLRRILAFPIVRLIAATALMALFVAGTTYAFHLAGHEGKITTEGCLAVSALLALAITVRLLERKPFFATLLPPAGAARDVAIGFGLGAALLTGSVGVLAIAGCYHLGGLAAPGVPAMARWFLLLFLVAVFEETFFRGVVHRLLEETFGTWVALAGSALFFGFAHWNSPGATLHSSVFIAVEAGVLLGAIFMVRRTLWMVIGVHWAWNFFEGPVFGTGVSGKHTPSILAATVDGPVLLTGGPFGPEAGLACVVVCTAVGVAFVVHAVRRGRTMPPSWRRPKPAAPPPEPAPTAPPEAA